MDARRGVDGGAPPQAGARQAVGAGLLRAGASSSSELLLLYDVRRQTDQKND